MIKNMKAAIFDLDGTLIDSMQIWNQIDIDYLNLFNIDVPDNLQQEICHLNFEETACYFKNRFNIPKSVEEIMQDWNSMVEESYAAVKLKKGAKEFLEYLHSSNIKIGLATSNSNHLLEIALKSNNVLHLFDAITTTSEVKRNKEFPDIYMLAAKRLNENPEDCIVFEDLSIAIKGAKKGDFKVIGILDDWNTDQWSDIRNHSDLAIHDYTELNLQYN